jgi:hypothetical protein
MSESFWSAVAQMAMDRHFSARKGLGLTQAATKEEFYGFRAADVVLVHAHKNGVGAGPFFRLSDGRVFDVAAQRHTERTDPSWYDQSTH